MISGVSRTRVLAGLLLAAAGCAGQQATRTGESPLPREIHGLPLADSASGAAAATMVNQMHQQGVAPVATWVGTYGGAPMQATLYVSRYQSPAEATAQLGLMAERIGRGTPDYGHHSVRTIAGTPVHSVFGHGQVHYFFASGADLTWLALPPQISRAGLAVVLGVPADSVPPVAGPMPLRAPTGSDSAR